MTPAEHKAAAEAELAAADAQPGLAMVHLAKAQVHATLATAAS